MDISGKWLSQIILFIILMTSCHAQSNKLHDSRYFRAITYENDGHFVPVMYRNEPITETAPAVTTTSTGVQNVAALQSTKDQHQYQQHLQQQQLRQMQKRSISIRLKDLQKFISQLIDNVAETDESSNGRAMSTNLLFNDKVIERIRRFIENYLFDGSSSTNAMQSTGRVFLLKGFKKFMWPVFIGIQVAKTVLLAMFLPSIIGSIGKMVGKGLVSVSGFGQPQETVDDFEFKDVPTTDDHTNGMGYNYPQQMITANQNNVEMTAYDSAPSANNQMSLYDLGQKYGGNMVTIQDLTQRKEMLQSKRDDFKYFHDIPASSMLLSNYDPFYSPLLSRLDSVFHQLNLNDDNETCREKLVCLMYASPAKYMPYSNLVSAQLSRELNELRKPTSDNAEILRFFKYMRAARNGQDGQNCQDQYKKCTNFRDTDQPAMLTTYNDINKLVQARHF